MTSKETNILNVVKNLNINKELTKPEISNLTNLTLPTVNSIMNKLCDIGAIVELGAFQASPTGRKAQKYSINPKFKYIMGVSIRRNRVILALYDYCLTPLDLEQHKIVLHSNSYDEFIENLADKLTHFIYKNNIANSQLLGIGINTPGSSEAGKSTVTINKNCVCESAYLVKKLSDTMQTCVYIDKDTYSTATYLNMTCNHKNDVMFYLSTEDGVGSALSINGEVYRGKNNIAGEIGHIPVTKKGVLCSCGSFGCLETIVSDDSILSSIKTALDIKNDIDFNFVLDELQKDNKKVVQVFDEAIKYFSKAMQYVIAYYNPDTIYIKCKWLELKREFLYTVTSDINLGFHFFRNCIPTLTLLSTDNLISISSAAIVLNNENKESSILLKCFNGL